MSPKLLVGWWYSSVTWLQLNIGLNIQPYHKLDLPLSLINKTIRMISEQFLMNDKTEFKTLKVMLSHMVATSHMWSFKFMKIK